MNRNKSFRGASTRRNNSTYRGRSKRSNRSKQVIHESRFINRASGQKTKAPEVEPTHKFSDFSFVEPLQANLTQAGFDKPSAIQDKAIPLALKGRDLIGLANTGTGKTAAFLLPILNALYKSRGLESVLILAPTRELAQQIDNEFRKFSYGMKLYSTLLVGGVNINPQLRALNRRPHVIIGTPGRIQDHIDRGTLRLGRVEYFVLDEADRMLDMGFVGDIRKIASLLPAKRQTMCFSATFSDGVKKIAQDFMINPELISVKVTETNDHIHQDVVYFSDNNHKRNLLIEMLRQQEFEKVIVFGETKFGVQRLSDGIDKLGISSRAIHGNKSQGQRNRALDDFKTNRVRVLVATDVAARGLDIPSVSHVINFDTPQSYDDYVHRIGRTGRSGKTGKALTFVHKR